MALALAGAKGSGYRRQRILALTAHAGVGVALRRGMVRFPGLHFRTGAFYKRNTGAI
jgi:hypothetical protein